MDDSKEDRVKTASVSAAFVKGDVRLHKRDGFTSVMTKRGVPHGEPGQPALPWIKIYVSLPWEAEVRGVVPGELKTSLLHDNIIVEPIQPNVPTIIGTRIEWTEPDQRLYSLDLYWPETLVRFSGLKRLGGFAVAEIEVCPFRYHLKEKKLLLVESIGLKVTYALTGRKAQKPQSISSLRHEQKFIERVKKIVLNPEQVLSNRTMVDLGSSADLTLYPQVDYVLITSAALSTKFQRLANWRNILGLRSRVVTVEDIANGTVPDTSGEVFWHSSGYADGGTRDLAEAVRNFVKWASVNWLTDHVVLGGDTEIIPCRQALQTWVGTLPYGNLATADINVQLGYGPVASTQKAGKEAAKVLDNDEATYWECEAADPEPWIRLSIGSHKPVNRVDLVWGTSHPSAYVVQVSHDGAAWNDVYSTTTSPGGSETLPFSCASGSYVRLKVTGTTAFSLATMKIYGPSHSSYGGVSYRMSNTVTRAYLSMWMEPNPGNSLDGNVMLVCDGPRAGEIIPYNVTAGDTAPGWRFVQDLIAEPPVISAFSTSFVEICGPADYHTHTFVVKSDMNYIPADLYYSDIAASEYPGSTHHDWDADDNGIYGERYGGEIDQVNGLCDVFVGRIPVETESEAGTVIDKIINYEMYMGEDEFGLPFILPGDFAVSVLLAAQDWAATNTVGVMDGTATGKEDIRHSFQAYDPSRWIFKRYYQDYADVPAADQGPDLEGADKNKILDAIRSGCNVTSLSSHGSSGYLCYLVTDDIDDVINHPSIFYGNACSTNKFDVPSGEAFSEWALLNPDGAGVAYVGNSRFGWTGDNPIERAFWEEMLDSGILGEMFNGCKTVCHDWAKYSINLLGDPAMRTWSDEPKQIQVTHASSICTGSQNFHVNVQSAGSNVADAQVCATMTGGLFAVGKTDITGNVSLSISPWAEGTMRVTVSGKNLIPYFGTVTVKKCATGCPSLVACSAKIVCQKLVCRSIVCSFALGCSKLVSCGMAIMGGCMKLRPEEFPYFEQLRDIFGVSDVRQLVKRLNDPEFRETLKRLPGEIRRPVLLMLQRIREEEDLG